MMQTGTNHRNTSESGKRRVIIVETIKKGNSFNSGTTLLHTPGSSKIGNKPLVKPPVHKAIIKNVIQHSHSKICALNCLPLKISMTVSHDSDSLQNMMKHNENFKQ